MNNTSQPTAMIVRTGDNAYINATYPGENITLRQRDDEPAFDRALEALRNKDWGAFYTALRPVKAYAKTINGVTVANGQVLYNGDPLHGVVIDRIVEFASLALPYEPLCNFIAKLMKNTSRRSIDELYTFLEHKQMPITPEGNFIAYKGVRNDYWSVTAGKTKLTKGRVDSAGRVFNGIGEEIECERNAVCDDADVACSDGLHAGSWSYASTFGPRTVLVEIDPKDVVSVPKDCDCQKLRACRYKVVGDAGKAPIDSPTYNTVKSPVVKETDVDPDFYDQYALDSVITYDFPNSSWLDVMEWSTGPSSDLGTLRVWMNGNDNDYTYYNVPRRLAVAWIKECEDGNSAGEFYNRSIRDQY